MLQEQLLIEAILAGDDIRLTQLLRTSEELEVLLQRQIESTKPTNHAIGRGFTLLQLAAFRARKNGDPASVLIEHGATVDLHSACGLGMTNRIDEILDAKPDAIHRGVDSYVPMQFAITGSQPAAIACLYEHDDDPNRDLRKVAYFGWEDDIANDDYTPWKPIHMASLWGFGTSRIPVAETLASVGADLNAVSPLDGFRPLHLVAMAGRVEMIRFFVSRGVDVDGRTAECVGIQTDDDEAGPTCGVGCTPLMVAAAEGFPDATACLLELGADPTIISDASMTALDFAEKRFWPGQPYDDVVKLLRTSFDLEK